MLAAEQLENDRFPVDRADELSQFDGEIHQLFLLQFGVFDGRAEVVLRRFWERGGGAERWVGAVPRPVHRFNRTEFLLQPGGEVFHIVRREIAVVRFVENLVHIGMGPFVAEELHFQLEDLFHRLASCGMPQIVTDRKIGVGAGVCQCLFRQQSERGLSVRCQYAQSSAVQVDIVGHGFERIHDRHEIAVRLNAPHPFNRTEVMLDQPLLIELENSTQLRRSVIGEKRGDHQRKTADVQCVESNGFKIRLTGAGFIEIAVTLRIFAAPEFAVKLDFSAGDITVFGSGEKLRRAVFIGQIGAAELNFHRRQAESRTQDEK